MSCMPAMAGSMLPQEGRYSATCSNNLRNQPAILTVSKDGRLFSLEYQGRTIASAQFPIKPEISNQVSGLGKAIEQKITIRFPETKDWALRVNGSDQSLAAETRGKAQERFPLIRTTHGLSNNIRNNAIYDRQDDWMMEVPEGIRIRSSRLADGSHHFEMKGTHKEVVFVFRPLYYQKHKNLEYFEPWKYRVYEGSISGWSSWWAYNRRFNEAEMDRLLSVWDKLHLADYGYTFMQIDDVFQGEFDRNKKHCARANGYWGGSPSTWLDWKKDLFPRGLDHYVKSIEKTGFSSAIWVASHFSDETFVEQHPDWFVQDAAGQPFAAPWVSYIMDATNPEVAETLIRPTFRGLKNAGIDYVKIDILRHYLYDGLHNQPQWLEKKGIRGADVVRAYLTIAREEMGTDSFILACWGVNLPAIGLVDACRIGGDGYGPATMQQYNSWNGIVWRNDPDHCDIHPERKGIGQGNVFQFSANKAVQADTIIRPALASIAGCSLLLSDKPEVYEDHNNTIGLKRVAPVVFSVPGQLYDFDPSKTNWIKQHRLEEIRAGANPAPLDADQFGTVCPYWLNEFNTGFDSWYVLHRLNWPVDGGKDMPAQTIYFNDLGLDPSQEYVVYEFWTNRMLGVFKGSFVAPGLPLNSIASMAIRAKVDRPQLLSTNRHISQGCVDIEQLYWENNTLTGRSLMIADDEYSMTIYVPEGYNLQLASLDGSRQWKTRMEGRLLRLSYRPQQTGTVGWQLKFEKANVQ